MSKFRQNKSKEVPEVSTASLPDIVFIVLAFFVTVSSMKQSDLKVEVTKPTGKEIIQLDKNEAIDYINAGIPKNKAFGKTARLQLDDQIVPNFVEIRTFIKIKREERSQLKSDKATVAIIADKDDVDMDIIDKIENELRNVDALRINYSTQKESLNR